MLTEVGTIVSIVTFC